MQLVADTNIVVAFLLRKGKTRELLFSKRFDVFSPDRLESEILHNKGEFKKKASMSEEEFQLALGLGLDNLTIVPLEEYGPFKKKALSICPPKHEGDWPFFALALSLGCSLWSNDKPLKEQSVVRVFSTADLVDELKKLK